MAGSSSVRAFPCFLAILLFAPGSIQARGHLASGTALDPQSQPSAWLSPIAAVHNRALAGNRQKLFSGAPVIVPLPAQDAWSIQRRLESLGDEEFVRTARLWVVEMGDPARRALLLCAGATPSPGLTISGRERRERLSALALGIVDEGLKGSGAGSAWRRILREALTFEKLSGVESGSPLEDQGVLAAINTVAGLGLTGFAGSVATYMLPASEQTSTAAEAGGELPAPARCAFLLHNEAQLCLFRLYGVWFDSREGFLAFPRPPAGQAALFRKAFAEGAERESDLALQLLEARAESGQELLHHPDPRLRGKAVERLIRAVGEQALSPSSVRKTLAESVLRESNPEVSDAMLQGLLDLALAAGPDSQAVYDLRITLRECAQHAPIALVPSLLAAFDRLPRSEGEAGREVAVQDGASTSQLLESLWQPALRLDRDTTILTLRSWSRMQTKLNGVAVDSQPQRRAGALVLRLMSDSSEPERVRLVAAEALVGWPLDLASMQEILGTLASEDSSAHLRRAAYPLVVAGLERLPWQSLDGEGLLASLLRDMGHGNVDLRGQAVEIAGSDQILDRFSALESEQGHVLSVCLTLVEAESSAQVRAGLMDLIVQVANATPRPDLLAEHLKRPIAKRWVVAGDVDLRHLAHTYQALAGPGHGNLLVATALAWVEHTRALPQEFEVREQALAMALALEESEAVALALGVHRALHDLALEHLLFSSREAALLWSQANGDRLLSVHIEALAGAQGEGEQKLWNQTAYLEAKLLAAAVVEDDGAVQGVFNTALAQSKNNSRQRLLVLRDRARFFDSFGKQKTARAEWVRLAQWLSGEAIHSLRPTSKPGLDFEDLGRLIEACNRAKRLQLECRLWALRTADPAWKSETPKVCSQELVLWAHAAEKLHDPQALQQWLLFVETQVQVAGSTEGWLKLPEADQAPLGERSTRLRSLRVEWIAAEKAALPKAKVASDPEPASSEPGTDVDEN